MKFILLISACYLLPATALYEYNEYNVALKAILHGVEERPHGTSPLTIEPPYNITDHIISVDVSKLGIESKKLSSPFMLFAAINKPKNIRSNLFSITNQYKNHTKLKLTVIQNPGNLTNFVLESEKLMYRGKNTVGFIKKNLLKLDEFTKISIGIQRDKVSFWADCKFSSAMVLTKPFEDIELNDDDQLQLNDAPHAFVGEIQQLKIFVGTDESEIKRICEGDKKPAGDHGDAPHAASLTAAAPFNLTEDSGKTDYSDTRGDGGDITDEGEAGLADKLPSVETSVCECSEKMVLNFLESMPELKGPTGNPGLRGEKGEPGALGSKGDAGDRGEKGPQGYPGVSGSDGIPGKDGRGLDGRSGKDGEPGPPGPQGPVGPPGTCPVVKGTEETTVVPVKGERGPVGPPGLMGPEGAKGQNGTKGDKGDQGARGEKGDHGEDGTPGITGPQGNIGLPGVKGQKGDNGDIGLPGLAGMPATLKSLLTEELNPEEMAEIVDILRGSKGEKGDIGAKGDIGDVGLRGPPGSDGKDGRDGRDGNQGPKGPQGETGPQGPRGHSGERGEPGPPGNAPASAITLTKGPKGDHGHTGKPGPKGEPGPKGIQGPPGHDGLKGEKGKIGLQGPIGHKGMEGKKGSTGEKGEKGERATPIDLALLKGEKGETGQIGPLGPIGPPGPPGPVSNHKPVPGPPGPPGPPGLPGLSITGPKGEPATINSVYLDDHVGDDDFYTTSTVVYRSITALIKGTTKTPLGTLAFVLQEEILLIRVEKGWQYVRMGSLWNAQHSSTSTRPSWPAPTSTSTQRPRANIIEGLDILPTPPPRPRKHLKSNYIRLIALSNPYTGKMLSETNSSYGFYAIENDCKRQAVKHNINGQFEPLLNYRQGGLENLIRKEYHGLPVGNLFGHLLFNSWSEMFYDLGHIPSTTSIYGFNGKSILIDSTWPEHKVWHGANSLEVGQKANCQDWMSDSPKHFGTASTLDSNKLLQQELHPCNSRFIVLCVEVMPKITRRQRHIPGRRRRKLRQPLNT